MNNSTESMNTVCRPVKFGLRIIGVWLGTSYIYNLAQSVLHIFGDGVSDLSISTLDRAFRERSLVSHGCIKSNYGCVDQINYFCV